MHEPLTPNGAVTLTEVQGSEQHCFYDNTVANEGDHIVEVGAFVFALGGVGRLIEELRGLEDATAPTVNDATVYLPLDDDMEREWEEISNDAPELSALEFGRESYKCAACGESNFHDDDGVVFVRYVWCHEDCLQSFMESLNSVWDYTDDMLEQYL